MSEKSLVIVESPAKAKTINKFLGAGFVVKASGGHVKDLPKRIIAVDPDNGFKTTYEVIPTKRPVLQEIKKEAMHVKSVYLASDPDREGEAICYHLKEEISPINASIYRVMFNEITGKAVKEAIAHPGQVDMNLVDAQQARRVLDRLVGYKVSPLLWQKVGMGLSAGRVQSVALRLICEREKEIQAFKIEEYWTIDGRFATGAGADLQAKLVKIDGKKPDVPDAGAAAILKQEAEQCTYAVKSIQRKERRKNPPPPFITSWLQQEAYRRFKFPVKRTMSLAQGLYEGREIGGEGPVGLITYMRTDSTRVAMEALQEARQVLAGRFGENAIPEKPNFYASKKGAQDAHEAIRPTSPARLPESLRKHLRPDELKLYKLIWERFMASQMLPAVYDDTAVEIEGGRFLFKTTGSILKKPGFLALYEEEAESEEAASRLPKVEEQEPMKLVAILPEQHFTQPPPRYTEATLVKELETNGIGRPSTYASIISTLQDRVYVYKDEGRFVPSKVGMVVNDLLVDSFSDILAIDYTARLEEQLDQIEEGNLKSLDVLGTFYSQFAKDLRDAAANMKNLKSTGIQSDHSCPVCGSPMVIKLGRFGAYLACTKCKKTQKLANGTARAEPVPEAGPCPLCGNALVRRTGRYGVFISCSGFPACKYVHLKRIGVPCPLGCGGDVVERSGRGKRLFYGCSNYPACTFTSREKPVARVCPKCGAALYERTAKKRPARLLCKAEGCGYREEAEEPAEAVH
ncbi:MAG: type I DNA topoisomerase [Acidobacteriota bacterium]